MQPCQGGAFYSQNARSSKTRLVALTPKPAKQLYKAYSVSPAFNAKKCTQGHSALLGAFYKIVFIQLKLL